MQSQAFRYRLEYKQKTPKKHETCLRWSQEHLQPVDLHGCVRGSPDSKLKREAQEMISLGPGLYSSLGFILHSVYPESPSASINQGKEGFHSILGTPDELLGVVNH